MKSELCPCGLPPWKCNQGRSTECKRAPIVLPEGYSIALLFVIGFLAGTGTMALLFMVWLAKHFPGLWA